MNRLNNVLALLILIFLIINCSPKPLLINKESSERIDVNTQTDETLGEKPFLFTCGIDSLWITKEGQIFQDENHNGYLFDVLSCTREKAFYGDHLMIDQLINIYNLLIKDRSIIYFPKDGTIMSSRGEKLFEYFLSLADNFECYYYGGVYERCHGDIYLKECQKMIKTINGNSWKDHLQKVISEMSMNELDDFYLEEYKSECGCGMTKVEYNLMKKAYKEGKITLKNFGEV